MSEYTIFHNPRCSKSRQTLALLQEKGIEPAVYLYLEQALGPDELGDIIAKLGISPRELLRKGEQAYKDLQLGREGLSDEELLGAMCSHPKLIERPIVVRGQKAVLGRPPENVLSLI